MPPSKCRVRFLLPRDSAVNISQAELKLHLDDPGLEWRLRPRTGETIAKSHDLILIGGPFASPEEAMRQGRRAQLALQVCGAKLKMGIDIGKDRPRGGVFFKSALDSLSHQTGTTVMNDIHGVTVIEASAPTQFLSSDPDLIFGRSGDTFISELGQSFRANSLPDAKQQLALELYASSFFETSLRARLLTLFTVLEVLASPTSREQDAQEVIDEFSKRVRESKLSADEKSSLLGGVNVLRRKSISHTVQDMLRTHLSHRAYSGEAPDVLFKRLYGVRNGLIHGGETHEELPTLIRKSGELVGDLLVTLVGGGA